MIAADGPAHGFEQGVRMEADDAIGLLVAVEGLRELRGRPDQDVGVPDGGHAEFGVGVHFHPDVADTILDRRQAGLFGQAEEGSLHRVALIADRDVRETRGE
jgi:hypothetical protein